EIAFTLAERQRSAPCEHVVDDSAAARYSPPDRIPITEDHRIVDARLERRAARHDVDDAEARVLPEQGALRSAHDFNALDVREVEARGQRVIGVVHAVDDDADARILRLRLPLLAYAANRQAAGALIALVPADVSGTQDDLVDVGDLDLLEALAAHDCDRDRHVL